VFAIAAFVRHRFEIGLGTGNGETPSGESLGVFIERGVPLAAPLFRRNVFGKRPYPQI
jgi:hypothetical protein